MVVACRARLALLGLLALAPAGAGADSAGDLARYLAVPDETYTWRELRSVRLGTTEITELVMVSQTWRGTVWKHHLYLLRPSTLERSSAQAFLFIHGGRWRPENENGGAALPSQAPVFTRLAETLRAPVAVLRHVPFQPLYDRREDALIAYTFDHYLQSGDVDWPLLLPMVKSAVRAMDTVQAFARDRWAVELDAFTVTGASKRGWTSWLTAATDPRVVSVAPIVIDMLNMPAQIALQRATFGSLSDQVEDYENIDLPQRLDSDRGRSLLAMVDPYSYRANLDMPKLILLGTNDRYWPLDALRVYWDELPGPKHVLYVPNQGHEVRDVDRLLGGLSALHRYSARGEELPELTWAYTVQLNRVRVEVQSKRAPQFMRAWSASSESRDFREARWSSHRCRRSGDNHACSVARARNGYTAVYAEAWFSDRGYPDFPLATVVCIVGAPGTEAPRC